MASAGRIKTIRYPDGTFGYTVAPVRANARTHRAPRLEIGLANLTIEQVALSPAMRLQFMLDGLHQRVELAQARVKYMVELGWLDKSWLD